MKDRLLRKDVAKDIQVEWEEMKKKQRLVRDDMDIVFGVDESGATTKEKRNPSQPAKGPATKKRRTKHFAAECRADEECNIVHEADRIGRKRKFDDFVTTTGPSANRRADVNGVLFEE